MMLISIMCFGCAPSARPAPRRPLHIFGNDVSDGRKLPTEIEQFLIGLL